MNREMQYSLLWNKEDTNIDIGINNIIVQLYSKDKQHIQSRRLTID